MSIPTTGILTENNFGQSENNSTDIVNVFPVTKFYTVHITGDSRYTDAYIHFPINSQFGTNYIVFASYNYNYSGSSGTYDANAHSRILREIVISNRQSNGFKYHLNSGDGDNKNIFMTLMVVYSPEILGNNTICDAPSPSNTGLTDDGTYVAC